MTRHGLRVLALLCAVTNTVVLVRRSAPIGFLFWLPKLLAGPIVPFLGLVGLASALLGLLSRSWLTLAAGVYSGWAAWKYLHSTTNQLDRSMEGRFARAFGAQWKERLTANVTLEQKKAMLQRRWTWVMPKPSPARIIRDIPFWSDGQTGRRLLCDLWLRPAQIPSTRLGIVYFHGSGWILGDKDFGTRDFFSHLAAQGHVIMDAQYRLVPEVDAAPMFSDVKHAIAWFKDKAQEYGVDQRRIVAAGLSSGATLAMLAAYAPNVPELTPADLQAIDLAVCAVVCYSGVYDFRRVYYYNHQELIPYARLAVHANNRFLLNLSKLLLPLVTGDRHKAEQLAVGFSNLAIVARQEPLFGGTPEEQPELYARYSPLTYAGPNSPPTFMVQGADDVGVPVDLAYQIEDRLQQSGVPVVNLVLPHADHAFDVVLPRLSAPVQSTLYELDRFLALI